MKDASKYLSATEYEKWVREQVLIGWRQAQRGDVQPYNMQDIIERAKARSKHT